MVFFQSGCSFVFGGCVLFVLLVFLLVVFFGGGFCLADMDSSSCLLLDSFLFCRLHLRCIPTLLAHYAVRLTRCLRKLSP